jgi:N-acyl-L-homoserine lactone synthetase
MTESVRFEPKQTVVIPGTTQSPFDMRIVTRDAERSDVFALRLRAYEQFMQPDHVAVADEYSDEFDSLPTTVLMGAYDGEKLVGAMRLCFSPAWETLDTLPCAPYYPALKQLKRTAKSSLMEVSRFSLEPTLSNTSYRTTLYASLVRASLMAAEAAEVSKILIGTRPDWVRFYKYMLGFELIGEPALYPPGDIKIAMLAGSLAQAKARQRMQNAFFRITDAEIISLRRTLRPMLERVEAA